jgi:hypothetical protein
MGASSPGTGAQHTVEGDPAWCVDAHLDGPGLRLGMALIFMASGQVSRDSGLPWGPPCPGN